MIVVTTDTLVGRDVSETIGLVRGTAVRSRHWIKGVSAGIKGMAGGEVPEHTKLIAETREQALDRMIEEARARGADAVVGFRFATSEVAKNAAEVVAYGTAVKLG